MITLHHAEFYITNHCNINCERCNRFNNYNFRGHYDWLEHAESYQRWGQHIRFDSIGILGGEPLMNPNIVDWIYAIRSWWPDVSLSICTNGLLLNKVQNLYRAVRDTGASIKICVHNYDWIPKIIDDLADFYPGDYDLNEIDDKIFFTKRASDAQGVTVSVQKYNSMTTPTLYIDDLGHARLHDSDPVKAHNICTMASCHQFVDGKLYKCSVPPVLNGFVKQFPLSVSDQDRAIIDRPGGVTVEEFVIDPDRCLDYLKSPIEHCKFCPTSLDYVDVAPSIGKAVFPIQSLKI